ncbi:DUF929 domain-containing protein [Sulfuracidifex metallicus]|uniref:DUF929 domain-containing protein n=1 Tax=Sulfuracidifex metallicus DSM 6482 = JCM 9184 TaxID=523847 RepID=A0A6A9QML8_SULME|nr:DUF929 domain-containing protein [Sulfuracidifex metallicus]MUN29399.1 DUF929 domain-containing protein [Sulfuracidifex metallicus DSM 6482 = JCM 9184]WOE50089.1 DUF929 domain-containing protein [Sulfuracidifex metallicus DSM 6482 = JCM 9184]
MKRLGYIAAIVLSLLFFAVLVLPTILPNEMFHFIKVSNTGYSKKVTVYLISWYGCPYGASLSWPLYDALSHFGNISAASHYSIYESDVGGYVPGLIFLNFRPNSSLSFHVIYLYNQYLNASPNGTYMANLVSGGLNELKVEAPKWIYTLVDKYDVNDRNIFTGLSLSSPAYLGNPPHIPTTLIITGPNGTWILIGYLNQLNPSSLSVQTKGPINEEQLLANPTVIKTSNTIITIIDASGYN